MEGPSKRVVRNMGRPTSVVPNSSSGACVCDEQRCASVRDDIAREGGWGWWTWVSSFYFLAGFHVRFYATDVSLHFSFLQALLFNMLVIRNTHPKPTGHCNASSLPALPARFLAVSSPSRESKTSPQRSRLPDTTAGSVNHWHPSERSTTKHVNLCKCGTCQVLSTQGCKSDIHKNGHKLWYVMHSIVENLPGGSMHVNESSRIWTTMFTIVESIKCQECRQHSNLWLSEISPSSGNLPMRKEDWMFTLWKHHDEASKRVRAGGWVSSSKVPLGATLSWNEYLQNYRVQLVTCDVGLSSAKSLPATKTESFSLEVRY